MSLPAVGVGLDLDQRVVRRHVAKLEPAGRPAREPWIWGEGSVLWLTGAGVEGAGLGGVRPVKSRPGATTIAHGVLVGWSAARIERRGRVWKAARELAVESDRWVVRMRCERGYTEQLPDLAGWLRHSSAPVAVIAESGGRREDRQKMILEGVAYRVVQEALTNVIKHAGRVATAVNVRFTARELELEVSDAGRGPPQTRGARRPGAWAARHG